MSCGLTKDMEQTLLDALNDYFIREFDSDPCCSVDEYVSHDGQINLAYTEYDIYEEMDYNGFEYDAIQVSYNLYKRSYVYYLDLCYGAEKILTRSATIDEFVEDLRICNFDDFLHIDMV